MMNVLKVIWIIVLGILPIASLADVALMSRRRREWDRLSKLSRPSTEQQVRQGDLRMAIRHPMWKGLMVAFAIILLVPAGIGYLVGQAQKGDRRTCAKFAEQSGMPTKFEYKGGGEYTCYVQVNEGEWLPKGQVRADITEER